MLVPAVAPAQTTTFVSNTGQADSATGWGVSRSLHRAQGFTTGTLDSGKDAFALSEVVVNVDTGSSLASPDFRLYTSDNGNPGDEIVKLNGSVSSAGLQSFTPAKPTLLDASTDYVVLFRLSSTIGVINVQGTSSDAEDTGAATGWSIANAGRTRASSTDPWTGTSNESIEIQIKGTQVSKPRIDSLEQDSDPGTDDTYAIGDEVRVKVTFTEAVKVDTTNGTPTLRLRVSPESGGATRTNPNASYDSGSGSKELIFAWTVQEGYLDDNGMWIASDSLELNSGTIESNTYAGFAAKTNNSHFGFGGVDVDGIRPSFDSAAVPTDGESVVVTFSEDLDSTGPSNSAFTVKVDGSEVALSGGDTGTPSVSGTDVTLALAAAATTGQTVTVSYADPSADDDSAAVQDAVGNDADSFDDESVTNNSEVDTEPVPPTPIGGVWSATMTVTEAARSSTVFGYDSAGTLYPNSSMSDNMFSVGSTAYTVPQVYRTNDALFFYLAPLPSTSDVSAWTLSIGTHDFAFSGAARQTERFQFRPLDQPFKNDFTDDATLTITITASSSATAPPAPTGLMAEGGNAQVSLSWTSGGDGGSAITKHQYQQKAGSGSFGSWTDIPNSAAAETNATSYTVTGLTNGTAYTFKVRAVNVEGDGAESGEASATPTAALSDDATLSALALSDVTLSPTFSSGTTSYTASVALTVPYTTVAPTLNDSNASYEIAPADADSGTTGDQVYLAAGETTTITVTVTAENGTSTQEYTVAVTRAGSVLTAPTAQEVPADWALNPADLSAGDSFRLLLVSSTTRNAESDIIGDYDDHVQSAAASGHTAIQTYSGGFRALASTPEVDARDNTATTGTGVPIYYLNGERIADSYTGLYGNIWSTDEPKNENGGARNVDRVWTGSTTTGVERFLPVGPGGSNASTALGAPEQTPGSQISTTGNPINKVSNVVVDGLDDATRSQAVRVSLYGLSPVFTIAATAPPAPTGLSAEAGNGEVELSWTSGGNGGSAITRHQYQQKAGSGSFGSWTDIPSSAAGETNATSYTVTGLTNGTEYTFKVRAVNAEGDGAESDEASATPATTPTGTTLKAVAGNAQVTLVWTLGSDGGSAITKWQYNYRTTGSFGSWTDVPTSAEGEANADGYTVTGLTNGTRHSFLVRPVNDVGTGSQSDIVNATPTTTPRAVTVSFEKAGGSVSEAGGPNGGPSAVRELLELNQAPGREVTIPLAWTFEGGASAVDIDPYWSVCRGDDDCNGAETALGTSSPSVTFGPGDTQIMIRIVIVEDNTVESGEVVKLALGTLPANVTAGTNSVHTLTLDDDDGFSARFAQSDYRSIRHKGPDDRPQMVVAFSEAVAAFDVDTPSLSVTGGTVVNVLPLDEPGLDHAYVFYVAPDSREGRVEYELIAGVACAAGGICTTGGQTLQAVTPYSVAIEGQRLVSVADAEATEGTDATMDFTVTLDRPNPWGGMHVNYTTVDGTATVADGDYTATSGTVIFGAREKEKTVSVPIHNDGVADDGETFTLVLSLPTEPGVASLPDSVVLEDGEATGTIRNTEEGAEELTGTFLDVPGRHDGASVFRFRVVFNEEVGISLAALRDESFEVSGGAVTEARRVDGRRDLYEIGVEPDGDGAVTITLPGGRACDTTGAVCTRGSENRRPLSNSPSATVAGPGEPLTAEFHDVPSEHDGERVFLFRVAFSEDVGIGYAELRDAAFEVSAGAVTETRRIDRRNDLWEVGVEPDGDGPVTVTLPGDRTCGTTGAVCTREDHPRPLGNSPSATVAGPSEELAVTNTPATGAPAISGTAQVDETLTASVSDIADADGLGNPGYGYQWIRGSSDIGGATGSSYTLVSADVGERIKVRVSFTDDAGNPESRTSAATDPVAAPPEPLTASFGGVPAEHTGDEFTFGLTFSEEFDLSYRTLRDEALAASGGTVRRAKRQQSGSNQSWTIHVEPDGYGTVTVRLPAGSVETGDGRALSNSASATVAGPVGISVADARVEEDAGAVLAFTVALSRAASGTLTVDYATSDGSAQAGVDYTAASGTLTFQSGESSKTVEVGVLDDAHDEGEETLTLTLSNPSSGRLSDGEATGTIENRDPLPRALLARFGRTAAVHVVEHVEERLQAPREPGFEGRFAGRQLRSGMEREMALDFLRRIGGAAGMHPAGMNAAGAGSHGPMAGAAGGGMGAVSSLHAPGVGGGEIGMAAGAGPMGASPGLGMGGSSLGSPGLGMVGASPDGAMGLGAETGLPGGAARLGAAGPMAGASGAGGGLFGGGLLSMGLGDDLLTGSDFALNRESRGGILSFWSRGARSHFSGREGTLGLNGDVRTTMLGADYARGPLVAGLSLSHSRGLGEYAGVAAGQVLSSVTGLYPWLGYKVTDRVTVWGVGGYGAGGMLLTPDSGPALESGLSMAMAAAGTRGELVAGGASGFALAFKADALWVGTAVDGVDGPAGRLKATDAAVTRFRTGLEGSHAYTLGGRLLLTPSVELGLRHDGGDAETGAGMDVGVGLILSDAASGLSVDVRVRTLLVHQDENFRERGVALSLSYNPTPSTPLGFTAKVAPSWGGQATSGAEALWGRETMAGMAQGGIAQGSRFDGDVGYGLPVGSRFVGTPRIGFSTSEYGRDYRIGYGLGVLDGESLNFELGVDAQRRESPLLGGADNGVLARASLAW